MIDLRYRAFIQRLYSDMPERGWQDVGWVFFIEDPNEYIKTYKSNPRYTDEWRIKYLHQISDDEYSKKLIYTFPIKETIFYP